MSIDTQYVMTYRDLVMRVGLKRMIDSGDREIAVVAQAVADAYRNLPDKHTWRYYVRQISVTTEASQGFTVSYDHTGGAYERLLTITGTGSWPTNAAYGEIRINEETYYIERRISNTQVQLSPSSNPGGDTSGECTWFRASYELPYTPRQIDEVWRADSTGQLLYVPISEIGTEMQLYDEAQTPWKFTLQASRKIAGATDLRFIPAPTEAQTYQVSCTVRPWPLRTLDKQITDGVMTSGSTTFTSATAAFNSKHAGAILRITADGSSIPGGPNEQWYTPGREEYYWQTYIRRVVSATEIELYSPAPISANPCFATLSDPVDIDTATMLSYLEALAVEKYCHNHDVKDLSKAKAIAQEELISAVVADSSVNWNAQFSTMAWVYSPGDFGRTDLSSLEP